MPDIRITCKIADSLFISTSSSATLHSPFFSPVSRAVHYSCRGESPTRRSPIAICRYDSTCRIARRFSLLFPSFLSLIPSLVVYVRLYVLVQVGLKSSLGVVSAGRFAPGDTRRYIFPSVTMHRTSSKQRVQSTPAGQCMYVCVCVCITPVAVVYTTPTSTRPAKRKRYWGDTVFLATNCSSITYSLCTCEQRRVIQERYDRANQDTVCQSEYEIRGGKRDVYYTCWKEDLFESVLSDKIFNSMRRILKYMSQNEYICLLHYVQTYFNY